jgi:hypothetical protein
MATFKSLEKGWPKPGTLARTWLDQIYWGVEPLGPSFMTEQPRGHYYMPRVINVTGGQIATMRHAGDVLHDRMAQFVHYWEDWRRRRGQSVEARRRNHGGRVRVKRNDYSVSHPMPTPIARWVRPGDSQGMGTHESDWDYRYPRSG